MKKRTENFAKKFDFLFIFDRLGYPITLCTEISYRGKGPPSPKPSWVFFAGESSRDSFFRQEKT